MNKKRSLSPTSDEMGKPVEKILIRQEAQRTLDTQKQHELLELDVDGEKVSAAEQQLEDSNEVILSLDSEIKRVKLNKREIRNVTLSAPLAGIAKVKETKELEKGAKLYFNFQKSKSFFKNSTSQVVGKFYKKYHETYKKLHSCPPHNFRHQVK